MNNLEQAKKLLAEYEKKQAELLQDIKDEYDDCDDYEDNDELLAVIIGGELAVSWHDGSKLEYLQNIVQCQKMLVSALEMLEQNDTKAVHNANKAIEELVHDARMIKKFRTKDIQLAQNVIDVMNDIIKVCDEIRK